MHEGCAGSFSSGMEILHKIRRMGFNRQPLPTIITLHCEQCGTAMQMVNFETPCPACGMVYAVTPCHAADPAAIRAAGMNV